MNKGELIEAVARNTGESKALAEKVVSRRQLGKNTLALSTGETIGIRVSTVEDRR